MWSREQEKEWGVRRPLSLCVRIREPGRIFARRSSRLVVSGTAPLGPDGETVIGDAYAQAKRCFEIILEAVEGLGGTLQDVVRTRMFVIDASDWEGVARAHGEFFRDTYPASSLVVVRGLLDPRWRVEIEAEAELLRE